MPNPPEYCGSGTAAEIAYMGHNTGCDEFQYIHERESYEVLLAILKKKKKVSFARCPFSNRKQPRLQSPKLTKDTEEGAKEVPEVQQVPRAKEVLSQGSPDSFPLIADTAESTPITVIPPSNPPRHPPNSLPGHVPRKVDGFESLDGDANGKTNGEPNDETSGKTIGEPNDAVNG